MTDQNFLKPSDHFDALLDTLPADEQREYLSLKHARSEACYRGRTFVVYRMAGGEPDILDHLTVQDFTASDTRGTSVSMISRECGESQVFGYTPSRLFTFPVYIFLPLHGKLRWSTTRDKLGKGSLAFDIVLRTASRYTLRDKGVVYCETGVTFYSEFPHLKT